MRVIDLSLSLMDWALDTPEYQTLRCPYHDKWVRLGTDYRTCPNCLYCVLCNAMNRPSLFPHDHRQP